MNGPSERVSTAAQSTVSALTSTPIVLAILIFNVAWMGLVAWTTHENADRWERTVATVVKYCPAPGATNN